LTLDDAVTLEQLEEAEPEARTAWLQPVDILLSTFAAVQLDADLTLRFLQGQRLRLPDVLQTRLVADLAALSGSNQAAQPADSVSEDALEGAAPAGVRVRVYDPCEQLLGTARYAEGLLAPERVIATQSH